MALGYFILPTDFVPDFIPAMGFTDDLAALAIAFKAVQSNISKEHRKSAKIKIAGWFGDLSEDDISFIENQLKKS